MPLSIAVVGTVVVFAVASVFALKRKELLAAKLRGIAGKRKLALTPCKDPDSGSMWTLKDPECGSSVETDTSSDGRKRSKV